MALFTKEKKSAPSVRTVEFTDEKNNDFAARRRSAAAVDGSYRYTHGAAW